MRYKFERKSQTFKIKSQNLELQIGNLKIKSSFQNKSQLSDKKPNFPDVI